MGRDNENDLVFDKFELSTDGITGLYKQPVLLGHLKGKNGVSPLMFLQKPFWMSDKSFQKLVKAIEIQISLNPNNEITLSTRS